MKKLLDIFDYIFYRSYLFFSSHRYFAGMEDIDAISMMFFAIFIPVAFLLGCIFRYSNIMFDSTYPARFIGMLIFFIVGYFPLMKRYMFNKSIKKYNYRVFKERWGNEDSKLQKRRGWFVVLLFVNNILIFPIVGFVLMHYLEILL